MRILPASMLLFLAACEDIKVPLDEDTENNGNDPEDTGGDTGQVDGAIAVAPSSITLDTIFLGDSTAADLTVTNIGTGAVQVTMSFVGGHAVAWTMAPYTSSPAAGESMVHSARLTPTEWGDFSVSVLVDDSVSGGHIEVPITVHVQIDEDKDGFGSTLTGGEDCDDADASINPGATETWYDGIDQDCQGGDDYDQDGDGHIAADFGGDDCVDTDATVNPSMADTWYDGVDQDCGGNDDFDQDADGHPSSDYGGADCNDLNATINPDTAEVWYDGVDQDCDDNDDDQDGDGSIYGVDCDDADASAYPGATEVWYDGVDNACDGGDDYDQDADGFQTTAVGGGDCDDTDAAVNPGATDAWYDGTDSDCGGNSDYDADGDGYDSDAYGGSDCDDADAATNPGEAEVWYDGYDTDCDGASDYDQDSDGYDSDAFGGTDCDDTDATVYVGATEVWYNGTDDACDGGNDEDQDGDGVEYPADCNDTDATLSGSGTEVIDGVDNDCDSIVDNVSIDDAATGLMYGSAASMALGEPGGIAMGGDLDSDGTVDLVIATDNSTYGYAFVVHGDDAAAANGSVLSYDQATIWGYAYYAPMGHVIGPFLDQTGDGDVDFLGTGYSTTYDYGVAWLIEGGTGISGTIYATSSYDAYWTGDSSSDQLTWSAQADVDADGLADTVTACPLDYTSSGSGTQSGNISVFSAASGYSGGNDLQDADDQINGTSSYDYLGSSLVTADVDDDGYDDILAGAPGDDDVTTGSGAVHLFLGNASLSWSATADDADTAKFRGASAIGLGTDALPTPGDLDGDGNLDVVIGSDTADSVYVFLDGSSLSGNINTSAADVALYQASIGFAASVMANSDLDNDGIDDLAIGATSDDTAASNAGAVYLFMGTASWTASLGISGADAVLYGVTASDGLGSALAGGADLDADGQEDLAVGATGYDSSSSAVGAVYIVPGW